MKDVWTGLAALMAAIAALFSALAPAEVGTLQARIMTEHPGTSLGDALASAQKLLTRRRRVRIMAPSVLAVIFCVCALTTGAA